MALINDLLTWALRIKNQTKPAGNTETEVGGLFEGIVNFVAGISDQMANLIVGFLWKDPVNTVAELKTTYPNPKAGWAVLVKNENMVYVWGKDKAGKDVWIKTGFAGFPNNVATKDDLKLKADLKKTDGSMVVYTDKQTGKITTSIIPEATITSSGLMTKNDKILLNEINDGMKTNAEKYDLQLVVDFGNEAPINHSAFIALHCKDDYIVATNRAEIRGGIQGVKNTKYLDALLTKKDDILSLYANNVAWITLAPVPTRGIAFSSIGEKAYTVDLTNSNAEGVDVSSLVGLKSLTLNAALRLKELSLKSNTNLDAFLAWGMTACEKIYLDGEKLTVLELSACTLLTILTFEKDLKVLKLLHIRDTKITKSRLMYIETRWVSRVGQTTGDLELSPALYNQLTNEDKLKFVNKNITISFK